MPRNRDKLVYRKAWPSLLTAYAGKSLAVERDVLMWLTCGPGSNRLGVVRCSPLALSADLGHSKPACARALDRLEADGVLVRDLSRETGWFPIVLQEDPAQNHDHMLGLLKELSAQVSSSFSSQVRESIETVRYTVSKTVPDTVRPPEAEAEAEAESSPVVEEGSLTLAAPKAQAPKPSKPKREAPSRPTTDDVFNALVAKGMPPTIAERESDKFCGYYEANGWRVGRNPMKSWKGAVATWYRNWQERNPQLAGVQQRPALTQLDQHGRVRDM